MKCIKCQNEIHDQSGFCAICGQRIPRCPTCNMLLRTRSRFCPNDGTQIPGEILALIPEAPALGKNRFCIRCGRPCRENQKLCDVCTGGTAVRNAPPQQQKSKNNLVFILIPLLLLLVALVVGGCFALSNDLIDPLGWIEDLSSSREEKKEPDEDEEDEPREDPSGEAKETTAPAADAPTDVPSTEAEISTPETAPPAPAATPVYLNDLVPSSTNGKIWKRSNEPAGTYVHTNADAPGCWSDIYTPGHTMGTVRDNRGNVYTYGLHVDGSISQTYTISFTLGGQYTQFSGTCACPEAASVISAYVYNSSYTKYFEVYGDGKLLFTSRSMRYDGTPQFFQVDVTGIQELTIVYPTSKGPNEIATLFDGLLQ